MSARALALSVALHALIFLVALAWRIQPAPAPAAEPTRVDLVVVSLGEETKPPGTERASSAEPARPPEASEIPAVDAMGDFTLAAYAPASTFPAAARAAQPAGAPSGEKGLVRPVPLFVGWPSASRDGAPASASSSSHAPVRVRVLVDAAGEVSRAEFADGAAAAEDSVALAAALALRFEPARRDGRAVEAWTTVEIGVGR